MSGKIKVNNYLNKEESNNSSPDAHTTINPAAPPKLTDNQRAQLDALSNLPDESVRKEAENDPDCEPLASA